MWGIENFDRLEDFFEAAARFGYDKIELNHQIAPQMLEGIDLSRYAFSSVHEPCPSPLSLTELRERDWAISAPDEENRARGVASIKGSIDLAQQLNAEVVVVHCGQMPDPQKKERQLRSLFRAGQQDAPEFAALRAEMTAERKATVRPYFEAVRRSLAELLEYAAPRKVRLGLENRDKWFYIPMQDEMEALLALGGPQELGFVFDSGHAAILDRLGFQSFWAWLERFGPRMVECHLHDVSGLDDHFAPGLGNLDFGRIAAYLPAEAVRTLELHSRNAPAQVEAGLRLLAEKGAVQNLILERK